MKYYLTCDIGGTDLKYGVINDDYQFLLKSSTPTKYKEGGKAVVRQVIDIFDELSKEYKLEGIAISSTGIIDPKTTTIKESIRSIHNYVSINYKEQISKFYDIPVTIDNDVNCMALAEAKLGAGKDASSVIAMTIGTGIGGAIVIDGKLFTGHSFSAGEWGHMIIKEDIFQNLASTRALVSNANKVNSNISNGLDVFKLYDNNDKNIIPVVDEFFENLSIGTSNMIYAFNPEVVIIGGGITNRGKPFIDELRKRVKPKISPYIYDKTKIVIAQYKNDSGMLGAFVNFKNTIIDQ